jgi:hypothetical protein
MNFKSWLLNEAAGIVFTGWASDGRIFVNIRGTRYVYIVDAHRHAKLKVMAQRASGKALNEIKRLIALGQATQEEPPTPPPALPQTPTDPPPTQGSLF